MVLRITTDGFHHRLHPDPQSLTREAQSLRETILCAAVPVRPPCPQRLRSSPLIVVDEGGVAAPALLALRNAETSWWE